MREEKSKSILHIDYEYYVEIDDMNYTLHRIKKVNANNKRAKNETTDVTIGYYANLYNAINAYIENNNETYVGDFDSLKEYCDFIKQNNIETVNKVYDILKDKQ